MRPEYESQNLALVAEGKAAGVRVRIYRSERGGYAFRRQSRRGGKDEFFCALAPMGLLMYLMNDEWLLGRAEKKALDAAALTDARVAAALAKEERR